MVAAVRLKHPPKALDVLRVQINTSEGKMRRFSLNGLGMGLDAQVTAFAARVPRAFGGFGQYGVGALLALRNLRTHQLQVSVDGAEVFSGPSFLTAVMNGTRYGGSFHISPNNILTDSLADLLVGFRVGHLEGHCHINFV